MSTDFIDEDGKLIRSDIDTSGYSLVRSVQTGVVMDIDSAKNLLSWLQEKIETWELSNKEIGDVH